MVYDNLNSIMKFDLPLNAYKKQIPMTIKCAARTRISNKTEQMKMANETITFEMHMQRNHHVSFQTICANWLQNWSGDAILGEIANSHSTRAANPNKYTMDIYIAFAPIFHAIFPLKETENTKQVDIPKMNTCNEYAIRHFVW